MVKIGTVAFDLVAFTGKFNAPIKQAQTAISTLSARLASAGRAARTFGNDIRTGVGRALTDVQHMITSTAGKLTMLTGGLGITGLVGYAAKQAIAFEDAQMAFTTFLKSGEKAKALLEELRKFSDITPFTDTEVQVAGRALLAFGFSAEEIIPTLQYLGDAAAGTQSDINELVNILGKVRTKGKAQMEELNRFIERGVNIMPEMAKEFTKLNGGMQVTTAQVADFVSKGTVGFNDVVKALRALNSEGGLFQNAMTNLSTTTSGKLSTLKSAFDNMMRDVGKALLEGMNIKRLTDELTMLATTYKEDIMEATLGGIRLLGDAFGWLKDIAELAGLAFNEAEQYRLKWHGRLEYASSAGPRFAWGLQKTLGMGGEGYRKDFRQQVEASDARINKIAGKMERLQSYYTTPDPQMRWQREEKQIQKQQLEAQKKTAYSVENLSKRYLILVPGNLQGGG